MASFLRYHDGVFILGLLKLEHLKYIQNTITEFSSEIDLNNATFQRESPALL